MSLEENRLSRRTFMASAALGLATLPTARPGSQSAPASSRRGSRAVVSPAKWPHDVYRRFSVDIHVPDWDPALLSKFNAAEYVENMVRAGIQSLVQYTNSHVGLALWQTNIGQRHANLGNRDFFGEVVAACRRQGIHPLAYFSVIHDNWAFEHHQDWRFHYADGSIPTARYGFVCPNSPYREYVFACIKEIASRYQIDGMFFDMMFFPGVCYCQHCAARFKREHGQDQPRVVDWDAPSWRAFQRARQNWLLEFANTCTATAKQTRPGITVSHQFATVFHNWAVAVPLQLAEVCDYVGGDFYGGPTQHSLACKLYHGLTRNFPFEFHTSRTRIYTDHVTAKPLEEIRIEAFMASAHAAALLLVDYINVDGTLNPAVYDFLGKLNAQRAAFEPFLGGELLADVAIYFDKESLYNPDEQKVEVTKLKASNQCPHRDAVNGAARILQEAHIPFGVVTNANLGRLSRFRAVILPSVLEMTSEQADLFRRFVADGGILYASGPSSLDRFQPTGPRYWLEDVLGVRYSGTLGTTATYLTPRDESLSKAISPQDHVSHGSPMVKAELLPGAELLAVVTLPFVDPGLGKNIGSHFAAIHSNPPALRSELNPAAVVHRFGKGTSVWTAAPFEIRDESVNRTLVLSLLRRALRGPYHFEAQAHPAVEVTLFDQSENHRLLVTLVNLQQKLPQVPVGATLRLRLPSGRHLKRVTRLPERRVVRVKTHDSSLQLNVAPFDTIAMLVVEYT